MSDATPHEVAIQLDIDKKRMEIEALRRNRWLEPVKIFIAILGAFTFLFAFALDRYKLAEHTKRERRVAIVSEYDALLSKTLNALSEPKVSAMFLRINVNEYGNKVAELQRQLASANLKEDKELIAFLEESKDFAMSMMNEIPQDFEYTHWVDAIDAQETWEGRATSFTPDFQYLFGKELDTRWKDVQGAAIQAITSQYSLMETDDPDTIQAFRETAAEFQVDLHGKLD